VEKAGLDKEGDVCLHGESGVQEDAKALDSRRQGNSGVIQLEVGHSERNNLLSCSDEKGLWYTGISEFRDRWALNCSKMILSRSLERKGRLDTER
jgi:hypothetical protein